MKIAEILSKRTAEATEKQEKTKADTPRKLFLPGVDDVYHAIPNHVARSALFAPVARGRKKIHDGTVLVSRGDATIKFSGRQLDESQADVWMHAMHVASKQPLGEPVEINRAVFLAEIGRNASGANYEWLSRAMADLAFGMFTIVVQSKTGSTKLAIGKVRALHMINGYDYDENTGKYLLTIDPRWIEMYGNKEFALVDWEKRLQFGRGQDMAKAMQRLIAASSDTVQRYSLKWLMAKLEYASPTRKFTVALSAACTELVRLEIISQWQIETSTKGNAQIALWIPS